MPERAGAQACRKQIEQALWPHGGAFFNAAAVEAPIAQALAAAKAEGVAEERGKLAGLLEAVIRWDKVDREWDADRNVMPLTCGHPKEHHDGWDNEYDASREDLRHALHAALAREATDE